MKFEIEEIDIPDVKIIHPTVFIDDRGFFMEVFNKSDFKKLGLPTKFLQMNHSKSSKDVVRGLHFQWNKPSAKIMRVTVGEAFLVAVDIRKNSPTLGKWHGEIYSSENKKQLYAPAGFARGIYTLSDITEIQYLIDAEYNPKYESSIKWNDPDINIIWPGNNPILSEKDKNSPSFKDWMNNKNSNNFMI